MKLNKLREWIAERPKYNLVMSLEATEELVADIDTELKKASVCNEQHASGYDYRAAVRTGWNGAINRMCAKMNNGLTMAAALDEMLSAKDVPELNPGERKIAEARAVLEDPRMQAAIARYQGLGKRIAALEETSEGWKEWRDSAPIGDLLARVERLESANQGKAALQYENLVIQRLHNVEQSVAMLQSWQAKVRGT